MKKSKFSENITLKFLLDRFNTFSINIIDNWDTRRYMHIPEGNEHDNIIQQFELEKYRQNRCKFWTRNLALKMTWTLCTRCDNKIEVFDHTTHLNLSFLCMIKRDSTYCIIHDITYEHALRSNNRIVKMGYILTSFCLHMYVCME